MTQLKRQTDGERLRAAEKDIEYLGKGMQELKETVKALDEKVEALEVKMDEGFAEIIARLDAQQNQFLGASKLAKVLWFAFPVASAAFAWFVRGEV